ncbi:MAG TPA: MFS transporter [Candidatus Dormibacteraeota bacterium]|nr:MFS transporter [Candidatus Dormibacteraeota bacterium]
MASTPDGISLQAPKIRNLRWWIGGLLFASTVINYIDRQTLSLLAPYLKRDFHWTNTDYANLLIAFRVAYSFGQSICGRFIDKIGTRRGLTFSVIWYSIASICTSFARGFFGFAIIRFLLGAGESANWPGATKAVFEWFPKRDRALAAALFDSGSSIGGAIAPFLILPIYFRWGWRPAFVIPGLLGFVWLIAWRRFYFLPQDHPRITSGEREMILSESAAGAEKEGTPRPRWRDLLKLPQTWGTIISKALTDPVWFFVTDWFPIYLVAKGISLKSGLIAIWVPFIAADLGNFFGGAASGFLIRRGWSLAAARKAVVVFGGFGVMLLIPTILTVNITAITVLFALATFCYAAFSTIANVLPSDLYTSESVASVSGLSGTGAGIGTIIAFKLIGYFSDSLQAHPAHSFDAIVVVAGLVPFVGMILVLLLVRNTRATKQGLVRPL